MQGVTDLSFIQVALAYVFLLLVLGLIRWRKLSRGGEVLFASLRMTLQLMLTGYILVYLFAHPGPWLTLAVLLVMEIFAIITVIRRFKGKMSRSLQLITGLALAGGSGICIVYFLGVVVQIAPWYDPQYVIPLAGMFVGNSMTGAALAVKSLLEGMINQRSVIEEALILGAEPGMATRDVINSTLEAAILPTVNSMAGMGIVFLPGMMTGQILSGISPATAISYQIAIMLGILGSVSLSVILILVYGSRTFFTRAKQLREL